MDKNDRQYSNGEITVFWKPKECIHATICYSQLREVFDPRKRPWVNMEGASTEEIIKIVNKCPTDALTYMRNERMKSNKEVPRESEEEKPVAINIMKDGPIVVDGDFMITDQAGNELKSMKMVSLCRCGASNNMPYCDGTHRKIGFTTNEKA